MGATDAFQYGLKPAALDHSFPQGGAMTEHRDDVGQDELPLPDYDHLPVSSLHDRVRSLSEEGVRTLRDYEAGHAGRIMVLQILDHRLAELSRGAQPSDGDPTHPAPEAGRPADDIDASPAASPETAGPPVNHPSHGVPTNPAQPRHG
jgi:hypothetical protein